MKLNEVFEATLFATLWLSWVAVVIALIPTAIAFAIVSVERRWRYVFAGILGGVAGEACGVASLFLSLWMFCRGQGQYCNTAQGDMGLIITVPVGSLCGCLLGFTWTWIGHRIPAESAFASVYCYSGPKRVQNWLYSIAISFAFWVLATYVFARLMD